MPPLRIAIPIYPGVDMIDVAATVDPLTVLRRIRAAVTEHADAAMFALAEHRFRSVFQQLVACIISIRTRDEVSLPTAIKLLERAATPAAVAKLSVARIDALIRASSFHEAKAAQIREIARRTVDEFGGELPCDFEVLTSFRSVRATLSRAVCREESRYHDWPSRATARAARTQRR